MPSEYLPRKFKVEYECFMLMMFNSVEIKDSNLIINGVLSENEDSPKPQQWQKFWEEMDRLDVWDWKSDYNDYDVLDGYTWKVQIAYNNKKIKSQGMNGYPETFDEFMEALKVLSGTDITEE